MELIVFWIVSAIIIGVLADRYGRSVAGWVLCSLIFSPLIAGLFLLALGKRVKYTDEPSLSTHMRCPDCRELVRMDARKCKHCGSSLVPQQ